MILTIDVGNTSVALGVHANGQLGARWRLDTQITKASDEYGLSLIALLNHAGIDPLDLRGICLASVVPPVTGKLVDACQKFLNQEPLVVDTGVKTGVRVRYEEPRAVGADRIVDAAAVKQLYGGPACVVDFGTATTFDAISAEGDYLGGAISPGIQVGEAALSVNTAKLPRVDLRCPPTAIGRNTIHAIQSGLMLGCVSLVEGMVSRFRNELGEEMKVVATGALAETIAPQTKAIQFVAPWLTLDGLRIIWHLNKD